MGGLATRRAAVAAVVVTGQAVGLTALMLAILATDEPWPGARTFALAMLGGVSAGFAIVMLYRALATGVMGVVAPVAATGVVIPVVVGIIGGERPGVRTAVGGVVAFAGVILALREDRRERGATRAGPIVMAIASACGFGIFNVVMDHVASEGPLWAVAGARTASLPLIALAGVVLGMQMRIPRAAILLAAGAGLADASGVLSFTTATTHGPLSVAALLGSLYPVVTVGIAAANGERMPRTRWVGAGLAMAGVLLIASGNT